MATNSNLITRRSILQALAILPVVALPVLPAPQESTPNLYQATIDLSGQAINLAMAAMNLRDGRGTAEEVRAELVQLKAAVDAIVI